VLTETGWFYGGNNYQYWISSPGVNVPRSHAITVCNDMNAHLARVGLRNSTQREWACLIFCLLYLSIYCIQENTLFFMLHAIGPAIVNKEDIASCSYIASRYSVTLVFCMNTNGFW